MSKKVVRMGAVVRGGKVVGVRQTNTKIGLANKLINLATKKGKK